MSSYYQTSVIPPGITGVETMRVTEAATNALTSTTGVLRLMFFTPSYTATCTNALTATSGTAAAATPTLCRIGFWIIDSTGAGTLVASTPNDTTLWAAANTDYTKALSSPYTFLAGQRYAAGLLCVSGAATPTWFGRTFLSGFAASTLSTRSLRVGGSLTSQSDLPSTFTDVSLGTNTTHLYIAAA